MPPLEQQRFDRRYTEAWRIVDPTNASKEYVGLNSLSNERKGSFEVPLSPGEYKFTCSLPRELNRNIMVNGLLGSVVGGTGGFVLGGEEGNLVRGRKLPNLYCDVKIRVQTSKHPSTLALTLTLYSNTIPCRQD